MNNPDSHRATDRQDTFHDWRQRTRALRLSRSAITLLTTIILSSPAMAQQTPLTGRMLDGQARPSSPAGATTPAHSPSPVPTHSNTLPPKTAIHSAPSPAPPIPATPPQPPMPEYTNLQHMPARHEHVEKALRYNTPPPAGFGSQIGHVTTELLDIQANNLQAGRQQTTLGDEADAAYQRYLDSFEHAIPEFFQTRVSTGSGTGGGSQ